MTATAHSPLVLRPAALGDVAEIARIQTRAWQRAYRGLVPDAHLDALDEAERARNWRAWLSAGKEALVAELDGAVVGFCSLLPSRDADADAGVREVVALYVIPDQARRGAGRALLLASVATSQGSYRTLTLWVLSENQAARRFYAACGFADDGGRKHVVLGGARLEEARYRIDVPER